MKISLIMVVCVVKNSYFYVLVNKARVKHLKEQTEIFKEHKSIVKESARSSKEYKSIAKEQSRSHKERKSIVKE